MTQPLSNKTFTFGDPIDTEYVIELYAGDYIMIEETFTDVLKEYDDFIQKINSCYEEKDVTALKSAVDQVKPLCGFVGLTLLQSQCLQFEHACERVGYPQLADEFISLKANMLKAKAIIEQEKERLVQFNNA